MKLQAVVPTPKDLGKPVLTSDELQDLIKELSGPASAKTSPVKIQPKVEIKQPSQEMPKKEIVIEEPPMIRLPSSYLPSKASPSNDKKPVPVSPLLLRKSTDLTTFKIPKLNQSPSTSSPGRFPKSIPTEQPKAITPSKLKTIDIFKEYFQMAGSDKKDENTKKLTNPKRTDSLSKSDVKVVASNKKSSDEEKLANEKETVKPTSSSEALSKPNTMPNTVPPSKEEKVVESRMTKELKRLQEDIVKDAVPLKSRRSCRIDTKKLLSPESSSSDEDDGGAMESNQKKLKIAAKAAPISDVKPLSPSQARVKNSLTPVESPETKAKILRRFRRSSVLIPSAKINSPTRATRRSLAASNDSADLVEHRPIKRFRTVADKYEDIKRSLNIRPCSINLPLMTGDELKRSYTISLCKRKQVAMKSTNPLPKGTLLSGLLKRNILTSSLHSKLIKRGKMFALKRNNALRAKLLKKPKPKSDDEWEDCDDDTDEKETEKLPTVNTSVNRVSVEMFTISNIAFGYIRNGTLFKCLMDNCGFKTHQKLDFTEHIHESHKDAKWDGSCNVCSKKVAHVLPKSGSFSMISEFIHMMDKHLPKPQEIAIPEETESPPVEIESSAQDEKLPEKSLTENPTKIPPVSAKALQSKAAPIIVAPPSPKRTMPSNIDTVKLDAILNLLSSYEAREKTAKDKTAKPTPIQDPNEQTTTIVPTLSVLAPTKSFAGNNITGRVIPITHLNLKNITISPGLMSKFKVVKPPCIPKPNHEIEPFKASNALSGNKGKTVKVLDLMSNSRVGGARNSKLDGEKFREILRPWTNKITLKDSSSAQIFMQNVALVAKFKCLGKNCKFFTNSDLVFEEHISFHNQVTKQDTRNYMSCAYCSFVGENNAPDTLVKHIYSTHSHDIFQCPYCFYRSCTDFNVLTHQNMYHITRPRKIIELPLAVSRNDSQEVSSVVQKKTEFVLPMKCACE